MFVQELINTTTAVAAEQGVNNSSNLSEIILHDAHGFDSHAQRNLRTSVLFIMALVSSVGHVFALCIQYNTFGKRNLWLHYFVTNVLYSGVFLGYIPMLSQIVFETEGHVFAPGNDVCYYVRFVRTYFHTFSNFGLVSLAFSSYQIIVKNYFDYSISVSHCFAMIGGFYVIPAVPSILIYLVNVVLGLRAKQNCTPYFFENLPFSCGSRLEMMVVLTFIYLLPLLLITGYYFKILAYIWSNSSYIYTNKRDTLSQSNYKCIKMAFLMCLAFLVTNVPFIVQIIISIFFQSVNLNPSTAVLVEMLSLSNTCLNPLIYLVIKCDISYFKALMLKYREGSVPIKKDLNLNHCCYELTKSKACEANFVVYQVNSGMK